MSKRLPFAQSVLATSIVLGVTACGGGGDDGDTDAYYPPSRSANNIDADHSITSIAISQ